MRGGRARLVTVFSFQGSGYKNLIYFAAENLGVW